MLAIVSVLSEGDPADTVIFDEVDSGVSGKTAQKIGVLLKAAAAQPQVRGVTHLAQIAAMADRHLLITKQSDADRTTTTVRALDEQGRREAGPHPRRDADYRRGAAGGRRADRRGPEADGKIQINGIGER